VHIDTSPGPCADVTSERSVAVFAAVSKSAVSSMEAKDAMLDGMGWDGMRSENAQPAVADPRPPPVPWYPLSSPHFAVSFPAMVAWCNRPSLPLALAFPLFSLSGYTHTRITDTIFVVVVVDVDVAVAVSASRRRLTKLRENDEIVEMI